MADLKIITGNIFRSEAQTLVNTVNCVGVMGAGIALEFKLRYPEMFVRYQQLCEQGQLEIGRLWIYKTLEHWVLNFPTKQHWRYPSKIEYLHAGLQKFLATYEERGIKSVAFPLLGAQMGGLSTEQSLDIMCDYLELCSIPVEIYCYDPAASDDLFDLMKQRLQGLSIDELKRSTSLRLPAIAALYKALEDEHICQLNQLARVDGVGEKTLEKVYRFAMMQLASNDDTQPNQASLI